MGWSPTGPIDLGFDPYDWAGSTATAVNSTGTLIGGTCLNGAKAFVWTGALGVIDLQRHLTTLGASTGEWVLTRVTAVSADGLILAGDGYLRGIRTGWRARISSLVGPVLLSEPLGSFAPCRGQHVTFTVDAGGQGPLTFQWQLRQPDGHTWANLQDGDTAGVGMLAGTNTSTLDVYSLAGDLRGAFRAAISGSQSTIYSEPGFITVCGSDFDCSGFTDIDDFVTYVTAFESGSDDADFDQSGFVDLDDFGAFVHSFEAGC